MRAYEEMLREAFEGREPDLTEENVQARIRGNVVMALSNKFGWLVLTTGNKSEMSVGYATLYGDMAGGFAVLKDVYKAWVYRLVRWRNEQEGRELVPASVLERPPSAELRARAARRRLAAPLRRARRILEGYVEEDLDAVELVHRGLPAEDVERVIRMVDRAEYKRRQAPPGIKISTRAFGRDRRLPITNRYETSRWSPPSGGLRAALAGPHRQRHARGGAEPAVVVGEAERPRPRWCGRGGSACPRRARRPRWPGGGNACGSTGPTAKLPSPSTASGWWPRPATRRAPRRRRRARGRAAA